MCVFAVFTVSSCFLTGCLTADAIRTAFSNYLTTMGVSAADIGMAIDA